MVGCICMCVCKRLRKLALNLKTAVELTNTKKAQFLQGRDLDLAKPKR